MLECKFLYKDFDGILNKNVITINLKSKIKNDKL